MNRCIFCKIINNELPIKKIYEDKKILSFYDNNPIQEKHALILPKKHIVSINDISCQDTYLIAELFLTIKKFIIPLLKITEGHKILINTGKKEGQTIFHLHLHLLSGKKIV